MDETPTKIQIQNLQTAGWTSIEEQQLVKLNLGTKANPQYIKVNAQLAKEKIKELQMLLKEFKDAFTWTYKDLKGILPELAQHIIELDTLIPPAHQARYILNLNYVVVIKHDIDKLLITGFIQLIEKAPWLSTIVVVLKNNGKLRICVDFRKLNRVTKKKTLSLPFFDEVLNIITWYEAFSFLDGYSGYRQNSIAPEDKYKKKIITN